MARIAAALRALSAEGGPVSLRKKAVSHQVPKAFDPKRGDRRVDVGDLREILTLDVDRRVCVAESGVTFADLVSATLRHGLVPAVVPELKTITIGGAVVGCSIESSSFRYGGFHDSCLEYEVITAAGDVVSATPDNDFRLLFQMMHGTFGTLGVLSKLAFRLVPAKPFVRVRHERFATLAEYLAAIRRHVSRDDVDFIDGFIHGPTRGSSSYVLSLASFVDRAPYTSRYDWMKAFCESTLVRDVDYLRARDYFFRYDKGVTNVHPKSAFGRLLLGPWLGSAQLLRIAERARWLLPSRPDVTVDLFIPFSKVARFLDWYAGELDAYPLWCVPYRRVRDYEWVAPRVYAGLDPREDDLFIDLAIYGVKQRSGKNEYRLLEEKLLEIGAIKTLISHNYFTEDELWSLWNRDNYRAVKAAFDPRNLFRDLYQKTCSHSGE